MPLTYDIVAESPQVRVAASEAVSMPAMIAIMEQVAADPRFRPDFSVTFDLRSATYTAELADGDALVAALRQQKGTFRGRFAVVVPKSLEILTRLYCALATAGGFDRIGCFTSMVEAQTWCKAPS